LKQQTTSKKFKDNDTFLEAEQQKPMKGTRLHRCALRAGVVRGHRYGAACARHRNVAMNSGGS
jgi:hypothetical protein